MTVQTYVGLWLCRSIAVIFAVLETRGCILHYLKEPWTGHAHFHSFTGLSYYILAVIFFFMITGEPFRQKRYWAWASMVLMGTLVHGMMLVIDIFTKGLSGGGTSQGSATMFYYLALSAFVAYLIGASLALPHFLNRQTAH